jgi:Na+-transporting NADH:ubiquinone oxidoreductase subunit NqrD
MYRRLAVIYVRFEVLTAVTVSDVTPCSLLEVYFCQIMRRNIPEDRKSILQRNLVHSVNILVYSLLFGYYSSSGNTDELYRLGPTE